VLHWRKNMIGQSRCFAITRIVIGFALSENSLFTFKRENGMPNYLEENVVKGALFIEISEIKVNETKKIDRILRNFEFF
jgi:hypothetical protein